MNLSSPPTSIPSPRTCSDQFRHSPPLAIDAVAAAHRGDPRHLLPHLEDAFWRTYDAMPADDPLATEEAAWDSVMRTPVTPPRRGGAR